MDAGDSELTVLVIAGPTAVGKTDIGLEVAMRVGGEIISADSAAVFRQLDRGTAKPSEAARRLVPHHGIDLVTADSTFSVADFQAYCQKSIADIARRGHVPIIVGGTALWIRAVARGYDLPPEAGPSPLRIRIHDAAAPDAFRSLRRQLAVVDPDSYRAINPHDHRRLVRAMEVFMATGRPMNRRPAAHAPYRIVYWVLSRSIGDLHERIKTRVQSMLNSGWAMEVQALLQEGLDRRAQSLSAIGYREMVDWLYGLETESERDGHIVKHSQQLAKRQLTWFRSEPEARWLDLSAWTQAAAVDKIAKSLTP